LITDESSAAPTIPTPHHSPLPSEDAIKQRPRRPRKVKANVELFAAPPIPSKLTIDYTQPVSAPLQIDDDPGKIQKSELTIGEPRRHRDKDHLKFVASQPCLVCGRSPADAHHLRFTQPRAMGRKVSDEFTVPLCRLHHRDIHSFGDEVAWWEARAIDPIKTSRILWISTRRMSEG
jgi:hypothetical protein